MNRPVVVNLKTGKALHGTIVAKRSRLLVMKGSTLLDPGHEAVRVDGDVVLETANVDFVQILPAGQ